MKTQAMLKSHKMPRSQGGDLARCIDACHMCAQACTSCADACLAEEQVAMLARCIRSDLDCSDMCIATARLLSRQTEPDSSIIQQQVRAMEAACRACAQECEKHQDKHEHCRICAQACRECEEACRQVAA